VIEYVGVIFLAADVILRNVKHQRNGERCEKRMAKVQALKWNEFFAGSVVPKQEQNQHVKKALVLLSAGAALTVSGVLLAHGVHVSPDAITAFAHSAASDPSFQAQLAQATKPIRDLINGFAHEIYFVFMSWGALEAMIGKPQQGFTRMKTATFAYVLLFWVPWIVDKVSLVGPVGR
jgi:hypothetical protein